MAGDASRGLLTICAGAATPIIVGLLAVWRVRGNAAVFAQANLDRSTAATLDRYEREIAELRARCELLDRRARRADNGWHQLRHDFLNYRLGRGDTAPLPPIPLLEDPFT